MLAAKLGLTAEEKATMFDLAARGRKEVPSDIEDVMMYSEVGKMARLALRKTNTGEITEEDWKQFIRKKKQKQD